MRAVPHGDPARIGRRRDRAADVRPGDRGDRQGAASTGWCLNRAPSSAPTRARMPRATRRTIWADVPAPSWRTRRPRPRRRSSVPPAIASPDARVSVPAAGTRRGRRACPDHRERSGKPRGRGARGALYVRAGRRGRAARHLAHGAHAGHGTHHFAVNDVFVRTDRTVLSQTAPLIEDAPLYRIPRTLLFASGDAAARWHVAHVSGDLRRAGRRQDAARHANLLRESDDPDDGRPGGGALRSGRAFLYERCVRPGRRA